MDLKIADVLKAVKGRPLGPLHEDLRIEKISTDTRTINRNDLFFALHGPNFDGHAFVEDAAKKGATHFIISNAKKAPADADGLNVIVVPDVLAAYGDLAQFFRGRFEIPAIAVTGSSGKTTVKELLAQALSTQFSVLKNRGTENNLIGVPKTILQLEASHEVLLLEIGTNQPGEIPRLSSIAAPQIGILTQIGHSHLEGLKNIEGVLEEKLGLLANLQRGGTLLLNNEDPLLRNVKSGAHRVLRVGFQKEGNDFFADNIWCHESGSSFRLNEKEIFEIPLVGRHNILNAMLAIAAAVTMGADRAKVRQKLKEFKAVTGRLDLKNIDGILFIDDSYNSNPTSFRAALETLKGFKTRGKKGVVFGDMLELGAQAENLHREMGSLLAELLFDFIIAVGPLSRLTVEEALKKGFNSSRVHQAENSVEAGRICRSLVTGGDWVLVKGSRGIKMEKVFECFTPSSIL